MSSDFNILCAVEANLIKEMLNNNRDYNHFHPSEWDGCHRKIAYHYYEAKGYIKIAQSAIKVDPQLQRIFDNGHWMHDRWRTYIDLLGCGRGRWLCKNFMVHHDKPQIYGSDHRWGAFRPKKCGCGCTQFEYLEIGFRDEETMWEGHVDVILDFSKDRTKEPEEDELLVVDFKTMNPYEFDKLNKPKKTHLTQMQIYLYLSGLPSGKFLYENKANQSVKEFLVSRDDHFIEVKKSEAIRLKYVIEHTNKDRRHVLPERAYNKKGNPECLRCKFRADCWGL